VFLTLQHEGGSRGEKKSSTTRGLGEEEGAEDDFADVWRGDRALAGVGGNG